MGPPRILEQFLSSCAGALRALILVYVFCDLLRRQRWQYYFRCGTGVSPVIRRMVCLRVISREDVIPYRL